MQDKIKIGLKSSAYAVCSILCFLIIWQVGVYGTELGKILPGPITVIQQFVESFVNPIGRHTMIPHILYSLMRVVPAFILAALAGIVLGILMGWFGFVNDIFRPLFEIIRPIPPIAWIPISIVWFGIGEGSKWFLIFLSGFIPITLNAIAGARSVDPLIIKCGKMLGASNSQIFKTIVLPYSVPYIFAGLQIGLSASWATVVAAEMIRSSEGVGWVIISSMDTNNVGQCLVGIMAIGIVGFVLAVIMRKMEERLCAWNKREG